MNRERYTCSCCGLDFDFSIDDHLLAELTAGNCVIFAGAGISTEGRNNAPHTLRAELLASLGPSFKNLPFPDLAEAYCRQPDGRFKLMTVIQDRFDYIAKFKQLRDNSKKFFVELATMPYLNTFVTTNWDKNFEECCAAKPFVYEHDIRFWDVPHRKVLKIHGTIDDYSSIIATRSDYNECGSRLSTSLVGSKLKECLTTKTCIFVGYSLGDDDFNEIFDFVREALGKFPKQHYFVSPYPAPTALPAAITSISTDGTHFLKILKSRIVESECYISDEIYNELEVELHNAQREHVMLWKAVKAKDKPQMLASAFYQDGLIDAYQLCLDQRSTGRSSDLHRLQQQIHLYDLKIVDYRRKKKFADSAYFRGYRNALISIAYSKQNGSLLAAPHYFYESVWEMERSAFKRMLNKLPSIHKASYRHFVRMAKKLDDGMVLHHPPWG